MNPNNASSLDLYAKVEDMLGIKDAAPALYAHYLLAIQSIQPYSLLDVGCGSGGLISAISANFHNTHMQGIDLSSEMVKLAKCANVDAECIDLCDASGSFDIITASFDVLNYLSGKSLSRFLACVDSRLNQGGHFLCDINTKHGFEDIAIGSFIEDWDDRFLAIDSDYKDRVYSANFVLFEKQSSEFKKSAATITQYYHTSKDIQSLLGMKLMQSTNVSLYSDEADKQFLVFKK